MTILTAANGQHFRDTSDLCCGGKCLRKSVKSSLRFSCRIRSATADCDCRRLGEKFPSRAQRENSPDTAAEPTSTFSVRNRTFDPQMRPFRLSPPCLVAWIVLATIVSCTWLFASWAMRPRRSTTTWNNYIYTCNMTGEYRRQLELLLEKCEPQRDAASTL